MEKFQKPYSSKPNEILRTEGEAYSILTKLQIVYCHYVHRPIKILYNRRNHYEQKTKLA
jgi:hypothetical protein